MDLTGKWPRLTFGRKLIITYLLFVMVPVLVVGSFAYHVSVQAAKAKITANMTGMLEQLRDNIRYRTDDIHRISSRIYFDNTLQNALRNREEGWRPYEATTRYILPMLDNVLHYTNSPIWLTLYVQNQAYPEIYSVMEAEAKNPLEEARGFDIYHYERIRDEAWVKALDMGRRGLGSFSWEQVDRDEAFGNISLLRRMDDIEELRQIGLIRVTVQLQDLFEAVDAVEWAGEGLGVFSVKDDAGNVLYTSSYGAVQEDNPLMLVRPIPGTQWQVEAAVPQRVFREEAGRIRNLTLLVCGISTVVLAGVGAAVSRHFAGRVGRIKEVLRAFQEGDFQKRVVLEGRDEFAEIAAGLNQLGASANELIEQVYLANLSKKEAELAFLQAQMNPHFLYNTLSSISRLAKLGELAKLHRMVIGLARFYRYTLNEGRMIISVAKELEQAEAYLEIVKMKYGNRVEVQYKVDPDVRDYDTVKMIFQPFIENCLEHAWQGDRIRIVVGAAVEGDRLVFRVVDDGVGMSAETVEEIFADSDVRRGYGIRNVDERIKLQYGEAYGVRIYSEVGQGTEVRVTVPKREAASHQIATQRPT